MSWHCGGHWTLTLTTESKPPILWTLPHVFCWHFEKTSFCLYPPIWVVTPIYMCFFFSIYSIYGVFLNRNGINPVVGLSERPESFINEILNPKVLPHACQSLIQYTMIHPIYTQYTPNNAVLHTIYNNPFKIYPSLQTWPWCFFLCCACNFSERKVTVLCNLRGFSDMFQLFTLV